MHCQTLGGQRCYPAPHRARSWAGGPGRRRGPRGSPRRSTVGSRTAGTSWGSMRSWDRGAWAETPALGRFEAAGVGRANLLIYG